MAALIENDLRDQLISAFRERVCETLGVAPFLHQRQVWAASDGLVLEGWGDPNGPTVRLEDGSIVRASTAPRLGGRARFLADLGAFKIGKSFGAALWASGFACVPGANVALVGLEYDICSPEFSYLCEFLLSERGMNMKATSLQNRPRDGKMWMDLENGAHFEARSWERKDSLKGKENDAYIYCLPLDAPVWMGDYSFKSLNSVQIGDIVISGKAKTDTTTRHRLQRAVVTAVHRTRKEVFKILLASGREVFCTADHKWANGADGDTAARNRYVLPAVGRTLAHVVDDPGSQDDRELAGWLGGMYDGEGCRTMICQSQSYNPQLFAILESRIQQAGFQTTAQADGVRWLGGRQAAVKFVNQIPSTRYREKYADEAILGCRYKQADKITSVESVGVRDVGCISTTTGNFIAYGYQTSNCEAYQLPGIECFTGFSQNLRARRGYAYFATTPDRPWIKLLHELGHGNDVEWHCTCSVAADVNPFTFDPVAKRRDATLMTREKYAIHYEGQLGDFVGRVFNYQRGQFQFTPASHPGLFKGESSDPRADLRVPAGWEIVGGADTGTYYAGLLVAFSPNGEAFVLDEFPNYRYVANTPERDESLTIPAWARTLAQRTLDLGGRCAYWADANSQFKGELRNYGITLLPAKVPVETRTEITREYFEHRRIWLAPWLQILPFELENAAWPEEASMAGKFARVKDRDHTLDPLEHILARRPFGRGVDVTAAPVTWAESEGLRKQRHGNTHMGIH